MSIRKPGVSHQVLVETATGRARVHLCSDRPSTLNPPPGFLSKLRSDIEGARIARVDMPWEDRILVIRFGSQAPGFLLVFEGSGHHSNLFLTLDDYTVVSVLRPSSSHRRRLVPGRPFMPPPATGRPASEQPSSRFNCDAPVSRQIESLYEELESAGELEEARRKVSALLKKGKKRLRRTLARVRADRERAESCGKYRLWGELLKTNLHLVRRGMESVEVQNFVDGTGGTVVVPLRAELTPKGNLQWLFKRYRKLSRAQPCILGRLGELEERLHALVDLEQEFNGCSGLDDIRSFARSAAAVHPPLGRVFSQPGKARSGRPAGRLPYTEFLSLTGRAILVGRGGKDNHALSFQVASPHDVWLHARGFPGSHVIVRLARNQEPDRDTLLDAAHLAIRHSKAPKSGFCEVMWTRRKHVAAVRKGRPGQVIVHSEKSVSFEFDPGRLARLLTTRDKGL